jgi:hypothetical protein
MCWRYASAKVGACGSKSILFEAETSTEEKVVQVARWLDLEGLLRDKKWNTKKLDAVINSACFKITCGQRGL